MEIQLIANYIEAPTKMQEEDFEKIKDLLEKYPFFHTANMLYVKAAHNISYEGYDNLISKISASVPNREILHTLINLTEKQDVSDIDEKVEKVEESDTRKEIRQRIDKRRRLRRLDKGEILNDNGKVWHELITADFFIPVIEKLSKQFGDTVEKDKDEVIEKKAVVEAKIEKEVIEKDSKTEDKSEEVVIDEKIITEEKPEEVIIDEKAIVEDKIEEKVIDKEPITEAKIEKDEESKIKIDETEDDKVVDPFTKIISLPSDKESKEKKLKDKVDEIVEISDEADKKIEIKETKDKKREKKPKSRRKTEQVIVEDIIVDELSEGKDEEEVIENIYDKIISSKKPKSGTEKKHSFIEIKDDINFLTDDDQPDDKLKDDLEKSDEIKLDEKTDKIKIGDDDKDKVEFVNDELPIKEVDPDIKVVEDIKDEIEFIVEDDESVKKESDVTIDITTKTDNSDVADDTKIDAIDDEFELIDKAEVEQKDEIIDLEKKEEKVIKETKEAEDKKTEKTERKFYKKEGVTFDDVITDIPEKKEEIDTEKDKEKDEAEIIQETKVDKKVDKKSEEKIKEKTLEKKATDAKAANDVFARIAAFKKKRNQDDDKDEKEDDLINKFVEESPSIKRPDKNVEEKVDFSEDSSQEKKPVITELMASIFINQGKYDQAIEIFEKLILKNPEKKDYFAAKIEETKKLK